MTKLFLDYFLNNKVEFHIEIFPKVKDQIYRDGDWSPYDRLSFIPIDGTDQWVRYEFASDEGCTDESYYSLAFWSDLYGDEPMTNYNFLRFQFLHIDKLSDFLKKWVK